jgi:methylthioribose-1-phosphate isomerase
MKKTLASPIVPGNATPFYFEKNIFYVLDQRYLPLKSDWFPCKNQSDIFQAISQMMVRGAPAIGITAAFGLALAFSPGNHALGKMSWKAAARIFKKTQNYLLSSRPTAVNLGWALSRLESAFLSTTATENSAKNSALPGIDLAEMYRSLLAEAFAIWHEEIEANDKIAEFGKKLLPAGGILTHCNTGTLATGALGTALGIIKKKYLDAKKNASSSIAGPGFFVYADETRPYLQGARLTAYELTAEKIPFKIITDSSAASVIDRKLARSIVVGADRIAANGDTANKIGTLNLAILAKHYHIPFVVAAPISTFDLTSPGKEAIPIEEREPREITELAGLKFTNNYPALNLAFDVTPHQLISALVTEKGVIRKPDRQKIALFFKSLRMNSN